MSSLTALDRATAVRWWVPVMALASFSFLLHFLWATLQVPLYADMDSMAHWSGVVACAKATAAMPLVLGIGVSPLLQWTIIPPLAPWLMQRHVAGGSRRPGHTPVAHVPSLSLTRN